MLLSTRGKIIPVFLFLTLSIGIGVRIQEIMTFLDAAEEHGKSVASDPNTALIGIDTC